MFLVCSSYKSTNQKSTLYHLVNQPGAKAKLLQPARGRDLLEQERQQRPHFLKDQLRKVIADQQCV